jgi:hypothetical protein
MLTVFIIFCLSLLGLILLFGHKIYEIKKGETLLSVGGVRKRVDVVVENTLYQKREQLAARTQSAVRAFFLQTKKAFRNFFISVLHEIHAWLTRFLERMKGRTSARKSGTGAKKGPVQSGSVSFFLKHVADHKEKMKGQMGAEMSPGMLGEVTSEMVREIKDGRGFNQDE